MEKNASRAFFSFGGGIIRGRNFIKWEISFAPSQVAFGVEGGGWSRGVDGNAISTFGSRDRDVEV